VGSRRVRLKAGYQTSPTQSGPSIGPILVTFQPFRINRRLDSPVEGSRRLRVASSIKRGLRGAEHRPQLLNSGLWPSDWQIQGSLTTIDGNSQAISRGQPAPWIGFFRFKVRAPCIIMNSAPEGRLTSPTRSTSSTPTAGEGCGQRHHRSRLAARCRDPLIRASSGGPWLPRSDGRSPNSAAVSVASTRNRPTSSSRRRPKRFATSTSGVSLSLGVCRAVEEEPRRDRPVSCGQEVQRGGR
jgi:hypothetical protein